MRKSAQLLFAGMFLFAQGKILNAAIPQPAMASTKVAVVSFKACVEGSKIGKQEQARFKEMEKRMQTEIEALEKEVKQMAEKFVPAFLDTLTPEKENELKEKFAAKNQELAQLQNQYYQTLNQANYQLIHTLSETISQLASQVAKQKGFDIVLNDDTCFYYSSNCDISQEIIALWDARKEEPQASSQTALQKK